MSKSFENALNEMLEDPKARERMLEVALAEMETRIKEEFKWSLPNTVAKECNAFIAEHVAPEIRAHLFKNKGAIVESAKKAADEIGNKITQALLEKVEDKISESWTKSKILDALFK